MPRMRLPFEVLDQAHRVLTEKALRNSGAPFDPRKPARFRQSVAALWKNYREMLAGLVIRGPKGILHLTDQWLYERKREEFIDDPSLPDSERKVLIRGLDRLNRLLGAYRLFVKAMESHLSPLPDGQLKVLDIGSGHGAFPIQLAKRGKIRGHKLHVIGSDISPAYVDAARAAAKKAKAEVEFRVLDALKLDRLKERFDVITCTQTIHHFPPEFLAELMYRARRNAKYGVLFFDARRSTIAVLGVTLGTLAVTGNLKLVHDGIVSVRRMYSPAELEMLAHCSPGGVAFHARFFRERYVVAEAYSSQRPKVRVPE